MNPLINLAIARLQEAINICIACEPGEHELGCIVCSRIKEAIHILESIK